MILKTTSYLQFIYLQVVENYLMDKAIELLKDKYIDKSFETLNYVVLDGKEVYF